MPPVHRPECEWCGHKFVAYFGQVKFCSVDCRKFSAWYKDSKRALSWRVEYVTCPNPDCEGVKAKRPGETVSASCNKDCEAAFRLHQLSGGRSDNLGTNSWIAPSVRLAIYERDNWRCQLCRKKVDPSLPGGLPLAHSLDHIIPRSLGGSNEPSNLQLAHHECNWRKGTTPQGSQLRLVGV